MPNVVTANRFIDGIGVYLAPDGGWVEELARAKRPDSEGTLVHSHHTWMIRSFWYYMIWMVVGGVLFLTIIGIPVAWLVWTVAWVWKAYRLIRGFIDLNNNRAMYV